MTPLARSLVLFILALATALARSECQTDYEYFCMESTYVDQGHFDIKFKLYENGSYGMWMNNIPSEEYSFKILSGYDLRGAYIFTEPDFNLSMTEINTNQIDNYYHNYIRIFYFGERGYLMLIFNLSPPSFKVNRGEVEYYRTMFFDTFFDQNDYYVGKEINMSINYTMETYYTNTTVIPIETFVIDNNEIDFLKSNKGDEYALIFKFPRIFYHKTWVDIPLTFIISFVSFSYHILPNVTLKIGDDQYIYDKNPENTAKFLNKMVIQTGKIGINYTNEYSLIIVPFYSNYETSEFVSSVEYELRVYSTSNLDYGDLTNGTNLSTQIVIDRNSFVEYTVPLSVSGHELDANGANMETYSFYKDKFVLFDDNSCQCDIDQIFYNNTCPKIKSCNYIGLNDINTISLLKSYCDEYVSPETDILFLFAEMTNPILCDNSNNCLFPIYSSMGFFICVLNPDTPTHIPPIFSDFYVYDIPADYSKENYDVEAAFSCSAKYITEARVFQQYGSKPLFELSAYYHGVKYATIFTVEISFDEERKMELTYENKILFKTDENNVTTEILSFSDIPYYIICEVVIYEDGFIYKGPPTTPPPTTPPPTTPPPTTPPMNTTTATTTTTPPPMNTTTATTTATTTTTPPPMNTTSTTTTTTPTNTKTTTISEPTATITTTTTVVPTSTATATAAPTATATATAAPTATATATAAPTGSQPASEMSVQMAKATAGVFVTAMLATIAFMILQTVAASNVIGAVTAYLGMA